MTAIKIRKPVFDGHAETEAGSGLPPVEQLLVEGGDARIALDRDTGLNKYGCSPLPDAELVALGSSTASGISAAGFAAADGLRRRLAAAAEPQAILYARELQRIRQELLQLCGLSDLPGLEAVMAASGTDAHLIAARLACGAEAVPTLAIMVEAAETGSGVPAALAGRHFSTRAVLGSMVAEGAAINGGGAMEVATVPVRSPDGVPRQKEEVDAEIESLALEAAARGQRVFLVAVDVSKTGLIVPSMACVSMLHRKLDGKIDVLIDACQFRIAPGTLRAYLEHGFMVALTGSKFVAGPSFSGALLIPETMARRLRGHPLPQALSAYSARADWPHGWKTECLEDAANFGLLLRWEAALAELRAFYAIPKERVAEFLRSFAAAIQGRLASDPVFELLPTPELDRRPLVEAADWDCIQTIFPFLLFHSDGRTPLSREEMARIYQLLQLDLTHTGTGRNMALRCQLGQPVACGSRADVPVSALRICASARMVVEAASRNDDAVVIEKALAALEKTSQLVRAKTAWQDIFTSRFSR
jgi:hypothetical protein